MSTDEFAESQRVATGRIPPTAQQTFNGRGDVDLLQVLRLLWRSRWWLLFIWIAAVTIGAAYAYTARKWYRAEVVLTLAEKKSLPSNLGQLGGLVSLAGITIGSTDAAEPLAILKSRDFARDFITDLDLLPVLFQDNWDANTKSWKPGLFAPQERDIRDGVRFFDEEVRSVTQDRKTGLVTLTIEWTDPVQAANWANLLVSRINERMRTRALVEAERNITYLRGAAAQSNVLSVQQAMGKLLESEMQKLMVARGSEEFSFKLVDSAVPPKYKSWPRRSIILVVAGLLGGGLGIVSVLLRHALRSVR